VRKKSEEAIPDTWNCLFCFDQKEMYQESPVKLQFVSRQILRLAALAQDGGMLKVAATHALRSWRVLDPAKSFDSLRSLRMAGC